mgnify:CR=1 FL=1
MVEAEVTKKDCPGPNSPDGMHAIRNGPFTPDPNKSEIENKLVWLKWRDEFRFSDQYCMYCGKAIW